MTVVVPAVIEELVAPVLFSVFIFIVVSCSPVSLSQPETCLHVAYFPMWRGIAIIVGYIWVLAFDIAFWEKHSIPWDHTLSITESTRKRLELRSLLRRAFFIALAFSSCFLLSLFVDALRFWMPIVTWCLMFLLLSLPVGPAAPQDQAYAGGTSYLKQCFAMAWRILKSPIAGEITFHMTWVTDQLQSFATAFRDFQYTACFYGSFIGGKDETEAVSFCKDTGAVLVMTIIAALPLIIRSFQSFRVAWKIASRTKFISFFKYLAALAVVFTGLVFSYTEFRSWKVTWIICAGLSTCTGYYCDLASDWGLLESKLSFLRRVHLFNDRWYYLAMGSNLLLRCAWVVNISPLYDGVLVDLQLLALLLALAEILRRGLWNLLTLEYRFLFTHPLAGPLLLIPVRN